MAAGGWSKVVGPGDLWCCGAGSGGMQGVEGSAGVRRQRARAEAGVHGAVLRDGRSGVPGGGAGRVELPDQGEFTAAARIAQCDHHPGMAADIYGAVGTNSSLTLDVDGGMGCFGRRGKLKGAQEDRRARAGVGAQAGMLGVHLEHGPAALGGGVGGCG